MAKYIVEMQMDKQEKFYFIRENESGDIVYLPSKYLMHKKRSKISPNTIRRSAFALSYYLNFLDENQLCLDDIYQMKYIEQHEHFTDFLIWLKAGMHSREDYLKLPNNETCNAYLKEVFRFYTFMEQENKHSESLKVLSDTQMIVRNSIGIRKVLNRKSFRGYLKEKGHQGKTIEQDKIVVLLQECANSRDQVLLLLLAETGFRIGEGKDGGAYRGTTFRQEFQQYCDKNGIADGSYIFKTHDYRHTLATQFYDEDVSIQTIRDYLGHFSEEMTKQYVDFMPKRIEKASDTYFKKPENDLASAIKAKKRGERK